jgi:hypothetical protein
MRKLTNCGKLEVRESTIEGFGVFATDDIKAGTILEEVPFVLFPRYTGLAKNLFDMLKSNGWISSKELHLDNLRTNLRFKEPEKYYFKWHPPVQLDSDSMFTVLPLGFGPCYNTSNTANNADWKMQTDTFIFRAEKDVAKDEEIRTFYGYFLGEDGSIFPCDMVFYFAIDPGLENQPKLKMLRFGTMDSYSTQRNNPSALKIHNTIMKAEDGLLITKIALLHPSQETLSVVDVPSNVSISALYKKLVEAHSHPAPIVKFTFSYTDKENKTPNVIDVIWKK